jgi:hypothetical protein
MQWLIDYFGLGMCRGWKKTELPKNIKYEFGNSKTEQ